MSRAEVNQGVSSFVDSHPRAEEVTTELMNSEEKREELREAMRDPKSESTQRVLRRHLPFLKFSSRDVSHSMFDSFEFQSRCVATARRHGPPFGFLTWSFDDLSNPRSFRSTFRSFGNGQFPAMFEPGCTCGGSASDFTKRLAGASRVSATSEFRAGQAVPPWRIQWLMLKKRRRLFQ